MFTCAVEVCSVLKPYFSNIYLFKGVDLVNDVTDIRTNKTRLPKLPPEVTFMLKQFYALTAGPNGVALQYLKNFVLLTMNMTSP